MGVRKKIVAVAALMAAAVGLAACTEESPSNGGGGDAVASSTLTEVMDRGVLRVASLPDFPPGSSQAPDGSWEGMEPDIAQLLADSLGVELEMVVASGETRLSLMQSGRADVNISAYTATNERAQEVAFTIPYLAQGVTIVYRTDNPITYEDLHNPETTVAVARGTTNQQQMEEGFPEAELMLFDSIADAIQAVATGQADAAMDSTVTITSAVNQNDALEMSSEPPLDSLTMSMGVLQGDQIWLNYLNNFITNLRTSGELAALYEEWFNSEIPNGAYGLPPTLAGN